MSLESYPKKIRSLSYFTAPDGGWSGVLARPGDVIDISEHMYKQSVGTDGKSWLDLSPEEQISEYGEQRFAVEETS